MKRDGFVYMAVGAAIGILLAAVCPAAAHHATSAFDQHRRHELTGTIRAFDWGYPHVVIVLETSAAAGGPRRWRIEGGTPARLELAGWGPASFAAGQQVTIQVFPARDGSAAGLFAGAKFADDSVLGRYRE